MRPRQRARAINAALRTTEQAAYLRPAGIRIFRARLMGESLQVQSLSTGQWIDTTPADRIELTHGARCTAIIQGGRCDELA